MQFEKGSLLIFRFLGVNVYIHWLWLPAAYFLDSFHQTAYTSRIWSFIEVLSLFGIVLVHEFGHALACKQVGGQAEKIILWPLGGLAIARPPKRPGALLWTVAAGPLVNVVLVPITVGAFFLATAANIQEQYPNINLFLKDLITMNLAILIFNMLPIYPLDGGQILQALLWFGIGQARSVFISSILGMVGAAALLLWALQMQSDGINLLLLVAVFVGFQAWAGIGRSRAIAVLAKMPRHLHAACPHCGTAPLKGEFWPCDYCHRPFDVFETRGACPNCATRHPEVQCIDCIQVSNVVDWLPATVLPAPEEEHKRLQALSNGAAAHVTPHDTV